LLIPVFIALHTNWCRKRPTHLENVLTFM